MNVYKLSRLPIADLALLLAAFALGYLIGGAMRNVEIESANQDLAEKSLELVATRDRLQQVSDKERFLSACVAYTRAITSFVENDTATKALIDCVNELADREVLILREDGGSPIAWTETVDDQGPKDRQVTGPSVEFKDGAVFELLVGRVFEGRAYVDGGAGHSGYTTPYRWEP